VAFGVRFLHSCAAGSQHLARFSNPGLFQAKTRKNDVTMWQNRHICTELKEKRHILEVLKKACSEPSSVTSNLECDDLQRKCTSLNFVTITHSKPGLGSGNISARNDPQLRWRWAAWHWHTHRTQTRRRPTSTRSGATGGGGSDSPHALGWYKGGGETTLVRVNEAGRRPQQVHTFEFCRLFFCLKVNSRAHA